MTLVEHDRLTPPEGEHYELIDGYVCAFSTGTGVKPHAAFWPFDDRRAAPGALDQRRAGRCVSARCARKQYRLVRKAPAGDHEGSRSRHAAGWCVTPFGLTKRAARTPTESIFVRASSASPRARSTRLGKATDRLTTLPGWAPTRANYRSGRKFTVLRTEIARALLTWR